MSSVPSSPHVLFIVGAVGVGKSDASFRVFSLSSRAGIPTARLDLDELGTCYPTPSDDPNHYLLKTAVLAAIWPVFRAQGTDRLVLAGGIESSDLAELHRAQIPDADWTICRLRANDASRRERVLHRCQLLGSSTEESDYWIRVGREEDALLDADPFADIVIDTDGRDREQVASLVFSAVNWQ